MRSWRMCVRACLVSVLACGIPGCNLFINNDDGGETNKSELKAFTSEAELVAYMRGQITQRNGMLAELGRDQDSVGAPGEGTADDGSGGLAPTPAPNDPNFSAGVDGEVEHSDTTTQEEGVEESDVVKTDGRHLYVISPRNQDSVLRIVALGANGETQLLSETKLEGYGRDLYLHGNVIVALTSGGGYAYPIFFDGVGGGAGVVSDDIQPISADIGIIAPDDFVFERPFTRTTVLDVSNRSSPRVLSSTKFDGSVASSRMVAGVMHLVLANYQDYYYDVIPRLGVPGLDVSNIDAQTMLPKFTRTNADGTTESGNLVSWQNLYRPADPDGFGVVSVVNLDVDDDAKFVATGVVAEPGLIYSSTEALYLTDTNYDWQGRNRTNTDIYKFKFEGRGATPVAFGSVPGRILNQYSMGEYNNHLRVATTIDPTWFFDENTGTGGQVTQSSNNVYILGQTNSALDIVGRIENIAPGESIQSARFLGDRGYLVTFLQIDPLFTVDLADPANPRVVGELKVPGFSTFLTPIDANHILAVGQYVPPPETPGNWGVQLSIFDVTDFANPALKSNVILGADANMSAYSEALWDPKALTYYPEQGVVALPMTMYKWEFWGGEGEVVDGGGRDIDDSGTGGGSTGSSGSVDGSVGQDVPPPDNATTDPAIDPMPVVPQGFEGVYVFRVSTDTGLTELGKVSTRFDETTFWGASFTRSVFVGQNLFAVTDLGIHSASLGDLSTQLSELFFGFPYDVDSTPFPTEPVPPPEVDDSTGGVKPDSDDDAVDVIDPMPPTLGSVVAP